MSVKKEYVQCLDVHLDLEGTRRSGQRRIPPRRDVPRNRFTAAKSWLFPLALSSSSLLIPDFPSLCGGNASSSIHRSRSGRREFAGVSIPRQVSMCSLIHIRRDDGSLIALLRLCSASLRGEKPGHRLVTIPGNHLHCVSPHCVTELPISCVD